MSIHPDDLPPIWETATKDHSPANFAFAFLLLWIVLIFAFVSPALVIAVWRWAL